MKNISVVVTKLLLAAFSAVTILLSLFLIFLIFDMWVQEGVPPFENLKFSVALFFTIIMLLVTCQCLKYFTDMAIDRRNNTIR
ncbi:hypothetical protein N8W35_20050 [Enterobacter roggenkampii]|uniref:hypothetical protein n=1 Tax=Enterobacter roggenkampii TaxID=1812935 RepID=UPI0021C7CC0A|nr:hypothetical protein [Enterobacter roggenkampii]MCU3855406.1 hypothetical protein [Enterobacter roggenkampii]